MRNGKISLITSTQPASLGKSFALKGGALQKETAGAMSAGSVQVLEFADVHTLSSILQAVQHDQCLSSSVPKGALITASIVTKAKVAAVTGSISRTKDCFEFPAGQRGVITIDYDPQPGKQPLSRDELWNAIKLIVPGIEFGSVLWWCSGSSYIFEGDTELQGLRGQRLYLLVEDIADTERFGKTLAKRLWLAGHGHIEISASGSLLLRNIVDCAMFQEARCDYIGGANCKPPLEQRRPSPVVLADADWYDTKFLIDLNWDEEGSYSRLIESSKAVLEPEAKLIRAAHKAARVARGVKRRKAEGVTTEKATRRLERAISAALRGVLMGDCEITLESGEVLTVAEILAHPERYDGKATLDPIEPEYLEYKVVGHLNLLGGAPTLFSHSHGGCLYQLHETVSRTFEDWQEEIREEAGKVGEVTSIAKGIAEDPELSEIERPNLLKACAKACNVALSVLRSALKGQRSHSDPRPVIHIRKNDFAGAVDDCLRILPAIPTLRQRSGQLVEVVKNDHGSASLQEVSLVRLAYLTAQIARWSYGDSDGSPDNGVLLAALGAGRWPGVPRITGLLHQPTIDLQTGEIISGSGYIPALEREAVYNAADYPAYSGDDAMGELRGLLKGFPFVDSRAEAATIAAILTAAIRPSLPTAPGFMVSAADRGSGKSFLCELVGAFGGVDGVQTWPKRPEEQSKVLFSVLLAGRPGVVFDNLTSDLKSDTLCQITTSPLSSDRELGASKVTAVSTACLWLFNGINVKPAGDLVRRVLTIELDARCERPWERSFTTDPVQEVRQNLGRWKMLALQVLSDFLTSTTRPQLSPFGSFSTWSEIVRGAIVANGLTDPLEALAANHDDADEEHNQLDRLLWFWKEDFFGEALMLRELVKAVQNAKDDTPAGGIKVLLEEIAGERGEINLRTLGAWFKKHRGKTIDGRRLVIAGESRLGAVWGVQCV